MFDKMKDLMEVKKQADRIKKELDAARVDIQVVNGIKITINGSQRFLTIDVDETHLSAGNKLKFQENLLKSMNAAVTQSQQVAAKKMKELMPGMPGF